MKKNILFFIFLNVFFIKSIFAEIVTLDDGRTVDLKEDGTFTVISASNHSGIEDSFINLLKLLKAEYDSIEFINNKILIKNIILDELYIEELILDNLNYEYFSNFGVNSFDSYKGQFFDNLTIKNISSQNSELKIDFFELKKLDFKETRLLQDIMLGEELKPFDFLTIIDSLSFQNMTIDNIALADSNFYGYLDSLTLNNFKNSSLDQLTYKNLEVENDVSLVKIDEFELRKLKFNSPSKYKDQFNDFKHPREFFLFFDSLQSVESKGYYVKVEYGVSISIDRSIMKNFKTKEINGINIPVSYQAISENAKLIIDDPLIKSELLKLGYKDLSFNQSINIIWNNLSNMFSFTYALGMKDGVDILLSGKFEDVDFYEIIDLSLTPKFEEYFQNTPKINKFELSVRDRGLTSKLIKYGSDQFGMPQDEFIKYILNILDSGATYSAGIDQSLTNDFIIALQNFIERPNKITFSINPKFSLSANDIINMPPDLLEDSLNMTFK